MTTSVTTATKITIPVRVSGSMGSSLAKPMPIIVANEIAATIATTASENSRTSRPVCLRAFAWCSKKFTLLRELHLHRGALFRLLDLEQGRLLEAEHPGDDVVREHFAPVVVSHDRIVERLSRERDAVLG